MSSKTLACLAMILSAALATAPGSGNAQETLILSTVSSTGTNTSIGTAQILDDSAATNAPLFSAALGAFDALNSDTVHQNGFSLTSAGQAVSPQVFPYGSYFVSVGSAIDAVGHLASPSATNYFGFNETDGDAFRLNANATSPPGQGAEILLYDPNGNLVAIANGNGSDGLSSIVDFTVPTGDGGTWDAAITGSPSGMVGINYKLQLTLPFSGGSLFTTNVLGNGQSNGGLLGAYDVNANVGDNLHFNVNATATSELTELELFDADGNLVAIASGNGSDGLSSIIDFTVPDGDAGDWQIQVVEPSTTAYAYDLAIQGASGLGPVNPAAVPEASTWAMLLIGFAGAGFVASRRSGAGGPRRRKSALLR
jgi:hypothetical protein